MKIISESSGTPQIAIHGEQAIKKENRFMGNMHVKPGQIMWELNLDTFDIAPCTYESIRIQYPVNEERFATEIKKLVMKDRHMYELAINKLNAQRKFKKRLATVGFDYKF